MDVIEPWDGARLAEAMAAHGHGPTECAARIHEIDPSCHPNKGSVIGWCGGKHQPRHRSRRALEQYIAEDERWGPVAAGAPENEVSTAAFDRLMESVTTERELKGRQAAFVDSLIQNLADGDFNEHYTATREQVARLIGLGSTL